MLPKDSTLKKEFKQKDVQRMRNIITGKTGDKTQILGGWENKIEEHKEGDTWEEDGKKWTIKNGIKQSITKLDKFKHLVSLPLTCPSCKKPMKANELNKKMYSVHKMCLNCVVDMEAKLKLEGKYEEYEKNILNMNKNASLEEFEQALDSWLEEKDTFVTEQGDVENWHGGDKSQLYKQLKEKIEEFRKTDIY
ncbi:MAG: hypothetical protein RLZZ479_1431 [Bacteroidota bacterium]|jgi:hypothetical protein